MHISIIALGGGTYLEKGYGNVRWEKVPFYAPQAAQKNPLFSAFFQSHMTFILIKHDRISKFSVQNTYNLVSFQLNTAKIPVQKPSFGPKKKN